MKRVDESKFGGCPILGMGIFCSWNIFMGHLSSRGRGRGESVIRLNAYKSTTCFVYSFSILIDIELYVEKEQFR